MKIAVGCDHAAWQAKAEVVGLLHSLEHEVIDHGTNSADSVDYPDYARLVVADLQSGTADVGVLLCGSGIGMSIAANKAKGIRAALLSDPYSARMAREHNDANVICFGARVLGPELIKSCLEAFLGASFAGGKHQRRVDKMMGMEGC